MKDISALLSTIASTFSSYKLPIKVPISSYFLFLNLIFFLSSSRALSKLLSLDKKPIVLFFKSALLDRLLVFKTSTLYSIVSKLISVISLAKSIVLYI